MDKVSLNQLLEPQKIKSLPEKFTVIVSDFALARATAETLEISRRAWLSARSELLRNNYQIREYRDEVHRRFKAECTKCSEVSSSEFKTLNRSGSYG